MNILSEVSALLTDLKVPFETGQYSGKPKDEYVVIVPLGDSFELDADNLPQAEIQTVRLSIFSKNNYYPIRNRITKALLKNDFTVTDRRYVGFESDTKYHHYAIDTAKNYELPEETGNS
jgi:hypothetical protein